VNNIENSNIVIIGNKIDLDSKREVTKEEGEKFCREKNYEFFEVSAKDDTNLNDMLFNSVASLPFFNSINTDGATKEQIVENLMKENMDSFRYQQEKRNNSESTGIGLNIVGNENKENTNNGDISLKENKNDISKSEESQVFHKKKKCC
jgi:GTPase SAR1 family protein